MKLRRQKAWTERESKRDEDTEGRRERESHGEGRTRGGEERDGGGGKESFELHVSLAFFNQKYSE